MSDHCNRCIGCTVQQCRHHSDSEDYCTLERVQIGTHENDPGIQALVKALQSDAVRDYIDQTYGGAVVPIF